VNFTPYSLSERSVHQLMPGERPLSGELLGNDNGLVMALTVSTNVNASPFEATLYQFRNLSRIHLVSSRTIGRSLADAPLDALTGS